MKVISIDTLVSKGTFASSSEWADIRETVIASIEKIDWPVGSGSFTIFPESGKKAGQGNGVRPIKTTAIRELKRHGWATEYPWPCREPGLSHPGSFDAALVRDDGLVVIEWETGNISSSHRSLNKMALGLLSGVIAAGILVVPSRRLYRYLTDRVGNVQELEPYFPLYRGMVTSGVLEVIAIEQDAESDQVPRIPKGKDGLASRVGSSQTTLPLIHGNTGVVIASNVDDYLEIHQQRPLPSLARVA